MAIQGLNTFNVQVAFELKDQGIAVNSLNAGFHGDKSECTQGQQTAAEGDAEIVRIALRAWTEWEGWSRVRE